MSERKVLNKYYPPDFDPTKIPKLRLPKNRNFGIRLMAPFNMRCNTCGEYIYKGKKFNSQKETVEDKNYLGLHIFRFYIKCPRCIAVIAFRTDPETTDYVLEAGATRNFEALRTAEQLAIKEQKEKEDELKNNPMKVLENRSLKSQQEIEMIETLEELRQIRKNQNEVDTQAFLTQTSKSAKEMAEQLAKQQEEEDEEFIKSVFRGVKRLEPNKTSDEGAEEKSAIEKKPKLDETLSSSRSQKNTLKTLIVKKKTTENQASESRITNSGMKTKAQTKDTVPTPAAGPTPPSSGLGLGLVGYSDDSDSETNDD